MSLIFLCNAKQLGMIQLLENRMMEDLQVQVVLYSLCSAKHFCLQSVTEDPGSSSSAPSSSR